MVGGGPDALTRFVVYPCLYYSQPAKLLLLPNDLFLVSLSSSFITQLPPPSPQPPLNSSSRAPIRLKIIGSFFFFSREEEKEKEKEKKAVKASPLPPFLIVFGPEASGGWLLGWDPRPSSGQRSGRLSGVGRRRPRR